MSNSNKVTYIVFAIVAVLIVCLCFLVVLVVATVVPESSPEENLTPDDGPQPASGQSLQALQSAVIPQSDFFVLAHRLEGKDNLSPTLPVPSIPYKVGDQLTFWAENQDEHNDFQVNATLRYATDHLYFWIDDSASFNANNVRNISEAFENEIYPRNREFFGSEWTPGVDGDPHIYLLYARNLGQSVGGYFSSIDPYPPEVIENSNSHEMIMVNADTTPLNNDYAYGTLAHEFEHMIQWYQDRNENNWMDEGFAELAAFLNGHDVGGFDMLYAADPDLPLTNWPEEEDTAPYYGSSFLFVDYFLDRFGEEATQTLLSNQENGLKGIDGALKDLGETDALTGQPIQADDFFLDWELANYIQDERVSDGRYFYHNYPDAPQSPPTENIPHCPAATATRDVHQYAVDYLQFTCVGDYTLHFEGSLESKIVPTDIRSGSYAFYSNRGDVSDMTLTREFDLTGKDGPLTLTYWTWYEIEQDYDYMYLEASTDGEHWQILSTPSGTGNDPNGSNYGWGYSGKSGGSSDWIDEKVDISDFAGQKVQIRFEYITDAAINGEGLLLDDVAIPEIGYSMGFEDGDGGWEAEGFVRIDNVLPQTFRLALISSGRDTTVQYLTLGADSILDIPLHIGEDVDSVTLVVTATNRYTNEKAAYRFSVK